VTNLLSSCLLKAYVVQLHYNYVTACRRIIARLFTPFASTVRPASVLLSEPLQACPLYVCHKKIPIITSSLGISLFVCLSVCLSACITRKPCGRTSPNFCACFLWPCSVLRWRHFDRLCSCSFPEGVSFSRQWTNGQNQAQRYVYKKFARWRYLTSWTWDNCSAWLS